MEHFNAGSLGYPLERRTVLLVVVEQEPAYRDTVLPPGCRARVSVEAAATFGWERWVGPDGDSVGMHGFGKSAPQKDLYEHFGFTPEAVAEKAKAVVERAGAAARS